MADSNGDNGERQTAWYMVGRHGLKLLIVGLSAACGLVVEIVAGRMIAPYLGMSLYTWTAVIAVVLAGFSVGHLIGGHLAERPSTAAVRGVAWSLVLAGLSTAASLILIRVAAPAIIAMQWPAVPTVLSITLLLFFLPSLFVGIPSPVLTKLAVEEDTPARAGRSIGALYAVGAFGSIAGTLAAGFLFISYLGTTLTLLCVAAVYGALAAVLFFYRTPGRVKVGTKAALLTVLGVVIIGFWGQHVRAFVDPCLVGSSYYCIRVIDVSGHHDSPARAMVLDHLGHGVNLRDHPQRLVSPYVELHDILARIHSGRRSPFRVFFVGGGAYTLPRAWLSARPDSKLTVAEIDPAVTRTALDNLWLKRSDRLETIHRDARIVLQKTPQAHFDVVVGDAFHDIVIPQHLVTNEFFRLVASRLRADGIYLMNVVDHRRRPRLVLSIFRTMQSHFKQTEIWLSNETGARSTFVLAGVERPTPREQLRSQISPGVVFRRWHDNDVRRMTERLAPIVLTDDFAPVDRLIGVE
ncbi:MAG: fused MFS/spermidine synthase [Hyphomicrobiaceae bacterium]